jgi:hypothetical protein
VSRTQDPTQRANKELLASLVTCADYDEEFGSWLAAVYTLVEAMLAQDTHSPWLLSCDITASDRHCTDLSIHAHRGGHDGKHADRKHGKDV